MKVYIAEHEAGSSPSNHETWSGEYAYKSYEGCEQSIMKEGYKLDRIGSVFNNSSGEWLKNIKIYTIGDNLFTDTVYIREVEVF